MIKDKLYAITWLDAAGNQKEDKSKLNNLTPKDLLVPTTTYGKLYMEDKIAVVILQEDSSEQVDYTVIPKSIIVGIKELDERREE